jgi:cation transport ATPase
LPFLLCFLFFSLLFLFFFPNHLPLVSFFPLAVSLVLSQSQSVPYDFPKVVNVQQNLRVALNEKNLPSEDLLYKMSIVFEPPNKGGSGIKLESSGTNSNSASKSKNKEKEKDNKEKEKEEKKKEKEEKKRKEEEEKKEKEEKKKEKEEKKRNSRDLKASYELAQLQSSLKSSVTPFLPSLLCFSSSCLLFLPFLFFLLPFSFFSSRKRNNLVHTQCPTKVRQKWTTYNHT